MTAFYMFRLYFLAFEGKPRYDEEHVHPHESPVTMTAPLVILAIPSLVIGALVGIPPDKGAIHTFLSKAIQSELFESHGPVSSARRSPSGFSQRSSRSAGSDSAYTMYMRLSPNPYTLGDRLHCYGSSSGTSGTSMRSIT